MESTQPTGLSAVSGSAKCEKTTEEHKVLYQGRGMKLSDASGSGASGYMPAAGHSSLVSAKPLREYYVSQLKDVDAKAFGFPDNCPDWFERYRKSVLVPLGKIYNQFVDGGEPLLNTVNAFSRNHNDMIVALLRLEKACQAGVFTEEQKGIIVGWLDDLFETFPVNWRQLPLVVSPDVKDWKLKSTDKDLEPALNANYDQYLENAGREAFVPPWMNRKVFGEDLGSVYFTYYSIRNENVASDIKGESLTAAGLYKIDEGLYDWLVEFQNKKEVIENSDLSKFEYESMKYRLSTVDKDIARIKRLQPENKFNWDGLQPQEVTDESCCSDQSDDGASIAAEERSEVVPETMPETVTEKVPEKVPETVPEIVPQAAPVPEPELVPEAVSEIEDDKSIALSGLPLKTKAMKRKAYYETNNKKPGGKKIKTEVSEEYLLVKRNRRLKEKILQEDGSLTPLNKGEVYRYIYHTDSEVIEKLDLGSPLCEKCRIDGEYAVREVVDIISPVHVKDTLEDPFAEPVLNMSSGYASKLFWTAPYEVILPAKTVRQLGLAVDQENEARVDAYLVVTRLLEELRSFASENVGKRSEEVEEAGDRLLMNLDPCFDALAESAKRHLFNEDKTVRPEVQKTLEELHLLRHSSHSFVREAVAGRSRKASDDHSITDLFWSAAFKPSSRFRAGLLKPEVAVSMVNAEADDLPRNQYMDLPTEVSERFPEPFSGVKKASDREGYIQVDFRVAGRLLADRIKYFHKVFKDSHGVWSIDDARQQFSLIEDLSTSLNEYCAGRLRHHDSKRDLWSQDAGEVSDELMAVKHCYAICTLLPHLKALADSLRTNKHTFFVSELQRKRKDVAESMKAVGASKK